MSRQSRSRQSTSAHRGAPAGTGGERVAVTAVRTLGGPSRARPRAPRRTAAEAALADRARRALRREFRAAMALREKLLAEASVGGKEKHRDVERLQEKMRSLIASLEGMSRFAIAMKILTPAENRAIWQDHMRKGLYEGWRP